jgi:hypothetical protein
VTILELLDKNPSMAVPILLAWGFMWHAIWKTIDRICLYFEREGKH